MKIEPFFALMVLLGSMHRTMSQNGSIETRPVAEYFLDQYNYSATLTYHGGYAVLKCELEFASCKNTEKATLVDQNGTEVASGKCVVDVGDTGDHMFVSFPINNATNFGEYTCKFGDLEQKGAFRLRYRTCSKDESIEAGPCGGGDICIVFPEMKPACQKPRSATCDDQHPSTGRNYCPATTGGTRLGSFCHAIAAGAFGIIDSEQVESCSKGFGLTFGGKMRFYNKPFELDQNSTRIEMECRRGSPANDAETSIIVKGSNGIVLDNHLLPKCSGSPRLILNSSVLFRADTLQMETVFKKGNEVVARMSHRAVVFGGTLIVNITKKGGYDDAIVLKVDPPPAPHCNAIFRCTDPVMKTHKADSKGQVQLYNTGNGEHQCHGTITCQTPEQGENYSGELSAVRINVTNVDITRTEPATTVHVATLVVTKVVTEVVTGKPFKLEAWHIGLIVLGAVAVLAVIIGFSMLAIIAKRKQRQAETRLGRAQKMAKKRQNERDAAAKKANAMEAKWKASKVKTAKMKQEVERAQQEALERAEEAEKANMEMNDAKADRDRLLEARGGFVAKEWNPKAFTKKKGKGKKR